MSGPTVQILVPLLQTTLSWRDALHAMSSDWIENDFCYVSDLRNVGGTYQGVPRPISVSIEMFQRDRELDLYPIPLLSIIENSTRQSYTHAITIAAMCNDESDQRVVAEIACVLASSLRGIVDFDSIDAPTGLGMIQCRWSEDGADYWTTIGDAEAAKLWLKHPHFHLVK